LQGVQVIGVMGGWVTLIVVVVVEVGAVVDAG
jgi:hypothetical protein